MKKKKEDASNTTSKYEGIVYRYKLIKPNDPDYGKSYIGETPDEKTRRECWKNSSNNAYASKKLTAVRKRTDLIKDWKYTVLKRVTASTKSELKSKLEEWEAFYIKKFNSFNNGFNSNLGGTGMNGVKGNLYPNAYRIKVGNASRGRKHTTATKQKISNSLKGRVVSQATRNKISKGNKGKKRTAAQNLAQSLRMKAALGGKDPRKASEAAKKWRAKNGSWWANHPITNDMKRKMSEAQRKRSTRVKATEKDGTEKYFETMGDAQKHYGIRNVGSVSSSIKTGLPNPQTDEVKFEKITDDVYQKNKQNWVTVKP